MSCKIQIIKDNRVLELINEKSFIEVWEKLARQSDKITVIQERPFVLTWYSQYINKYQPVFLLGYNEKGCIVGIIPLAFSIKGKYLVHAGDGQAEYHGWLCEKEYDDEFPVMAMIEVKKHFNLRKWQWRPMPPRSYIGWFGSEYLRKNRIFVRKHREDSPVLDLSNEDKINKIRKNKSIQIKLNRYKKKSGFFIERITSKEKAKEIFEILADQCDFRQMARHESAPFGRDSNKKQFYIERLNFPESNHFTVLWSDNYPTAFHFGACDHNTVFWGLSSYNPLEERNSPGNILIIKMIELLKEEGFSYFDLTPGGAPFKEKFSSFHQEIFTPTFYFVRSDKIIADIKHFVRQSIKKFVVSIGAKPKAIKESSEKITNVLAEFRGLSPVKIFSKLFTYIYRKETCHLYKFSIAQDGHYLKDITEKVDVNKYSDLLLYNDTNPDFKKKGDLFSSALKHFGSDDLLYTVVKEGILAQYAWMSKGGKNHSLDLVESEFVSPENSCFLNDFFTAPSFSGYDLEAKTISRMLIDSKQKNMQEVFINIPEKDLATRRMVESLGFKNVKEFQMIRFLWLTHRRSFSKVNSKD